MYPKQGELPELPSEPSPPPPSKAATIDNEIPLHPPRRQLHDDEEEDDDDDGDDDDDDDDVAVQAAVEGAYDPSEYDGLSVEGEVRDLFHHIIQYTPQTMDLEFKFRYKLSISFSSLHLPSLSPLSPSPFLPFLHPPFSPFSIPLSPSPFSPSPFLHFSLSWLTDTIQYFYWDGRV